MKTTLNLNLEVSRVVRDGNCFECKLGDFAEGRDKCVTASGASDPDLLVITRTPMGTRQREELEDYLKKADIDLEKVAYTAVNKCSVWDVTPGKNDIKTCASLYLGKEVDLLKPKVILALGNEALTATMGRSGIMKYRGKVGEYRGAQVFPTISPSMVARNPGQAPSFAADLRFVSRMISGDNASDAYRPKAFRFVYTSDGIKALAERLKVCEGYSFDIESNMFEEYKPDSRMVSFSVTTWMPGEQPSEIWVIPLYHPESVFRKQWRKILRWLSKFLRLPKERVAHNGKFDLRWLKQFGVELTLTADTMFMAHLLNENQPKSIKTLAQTYLGVPPWGIDASDLLNTPIRAVLKYNGLDTWYTAHVYFFFREKMKQQPRLWKLLKKLMVPASNVFTDIEMRGIWVDVEKLQTHAKIAKDTLDGIDEKLMKHVPPRELWPANVKEVNFNASNFARWWLFDHLGLPVLARGKSKEDGTPGAPSMAEGLMQKLAAEHPHEVIDLLLERVKWQKYHSSFFTAYLDQIDDQDRIHTTFKLTGTVTGRLSSGKGDDDKVTAKVQNRGVNLQQVPRDKFVKGIFGGGPGRVFLECDYSQIELRIAAFIARERTMMRMYQVGADIHMATAMKMTGKPEHLITKEERKAGKPVNFGFLYGMSADTFVTTAWNNYGLAVTPEESKAFRKAYFDQFPDLIAWHNRQRALVRKYKRVESPIGRVRHLPDIDSKDREVRNSAERQAINSPVQSLASDMAVMALITISREFKRRGLKARSVGTVHDAINFEVPIPELEEVMPLIKYHMENPPLEAWFGVVLDVPIIGDVALSHMWGDKEEVDGGIITDPRELRKWLKQRDLLMRAA